MYSSKKGICSIYSKWTKTYDVSVIEQHHNLEPLRQLILISTPTFDVPRNVGLERNAKGQQGSGVVREGHLEGVVRLPHLHVHHLLR